MAEEDKKKKTKKKVAAKKTKVAKPKAANKPKAAKKKAEQPKAAEIKEVKAVKEVKKQEAAPVAEKKQPVIKDEKKVFKREKKPSGKVQYHGVGGRKTSIARVWMTPGNGAFTINGKKLGDYVSNRPILMFQAVQPFMLTNTSNKYDVKANIRGGGVSSQIGAVRNAVAWALLDVNPEFRPPLRRTGMLTRDSRIKERKKFGHKRARKSFQYSKR